MSEIFYEIHGRENSNTIIMIHGAGVTRKWWHPQVSDFSKDYQVIVLDLPGHGVLASERFSMQISLKCLNTIFEKEKIAKAVLIGISLGGYLAIKFAHLHPERVSALILCGSSTNLSGLTGLSFKLTGFMLKRKGADWLKEVTINSYRKRVASQIIEPVIEAGIFPEAAMVSFFETSGINFHRLLKGYPHLILIANGENDEINCKAEKKLTRVLPNAQFCQIKDTGHLANLEQPEEFNKIVRLFLQKQFLK